MKRGDLVTVVVAGDDGKPRPALILQADFYTAHLSSTVLPLTSELHDAPLLRIPVSPSEGNRLRLLSQVMVDKAVTVPRAKVVQRIGQLDDTTLASAGRALAEFLASRELANARLSDQ